MDAVSAHVVLASAAEDPQGLDSGLFELCEPDKLDPEPDGTTVRRYSVPHFALEPDVHGRAVLGSLDRHVASDQLGTLGVMEQDPDAEFGDIQNAALSVPRRARREYGSARPSRRFGVVLGDGTPS